MDETAMTHLDTRRAPTSEQSTGKSASIELKVSELYEQYVSLIYNYLFSRVQNTAVAQDLTSQTFLAAVEYRASLKDDEKIRPWLFTIARNKANDHFRRSKRFPEQAFEEEIDRPVDLGTQSSAEQDELIALQRLIRQLPPLEQQIIHLRLSSGLTFPDIARVIGTSENRIKKIYYKVIERLKAQIED